MAPLEPWERVWIDAKAYSEDIHSYLNCTDCHGGRSVSDMNIAHEGMNPSPAADPEAACGKCHTDIAPASANSLHSTLRGYDTVLYARSSPEHYGTLEIMEQNHCNSCHTTCGDCHVSQPASVGGGLLKGHTFVGTPPMSQTCTACHGSRVKNEYYGLNEGVPGDVHFRARMGCVDCHTGEQIHGIGIEAGHRYDGVRFPSCESCHEAQIGVGSGIEQHEVHGTEVLSCQVCHSTTYTNCVNCHVEQTPEKQPFYKIEDHFMAFYIGRNPLRSSERPYRFVPVRHVPIDGDSFNFYGSNLMVNFDSRPTWTYSTPHNIQLRTPQTESCAACHGNPAVFLIEDKVQPAERTANKSVIVDLVPSLPAGYAPPATQPPPTATPGSDDFWGEDGAPSNTSTPTPPADDFWGGEGAPGEESPGAPTATPTTGDDFWGD